MRPCCFPVRQCKSLSPGNYAQCDLLGGQLGPEGTCCADPTVSPLVCPEAATHESCWLCEHNLDEPVGFPTSCCLPDLDHTYIPGGGPDDPGGGVFAGQCTGCNGIPGESAAECEPEPREIECIEAGEDQPRYPGAPLWTLNTAGTVVFGLAAVTDEWTQFGDDLGRPWVQVRGYTYGLSTHLIRPRELDTPDDPCGHAVGGLSMLDDGYCYMATCSQPDVNNLDSHRQSIGALWTSDVTDPVLGVEKGYQYWLTCLRLPAWTEVLYRSHRRRCEEEPR